MVTWLYLYRKLRYLTWHVGAVEEHSRQISVVCCFFDFLTGIVQSSQKMYVQKDQ